MLYVLRITLCEFSRVDGKNSFSLMYYIMTGHKTTTILLDGKRVKLQLWDTSGQGRFCTIIRSYSRGAQGILLVYDITNKWSFEGLDRWMKEIQEVQRVSSFFSFVFCSCIDCINFIGIVTTYIV